MRLSGLLVLLVSTTAASEQFVLSRQGTSPLALELLPASSGQPASPAAQCPASFGRDWSCAWTITLPQSASTSGDATLTLFPEFNPMYVVGNRQSAVTGSTTLSVSAVPNVPPGAAGGIWLTCANAGAVTAPGDWAAQGSVSSGSYTFGVWSHDFTSTAEPPSYVFTTSTPGTCIAVLQVYANSLGPIGSTNAPVSGTMPSVTVQSTFPKVMRTASFSARSSVQFTAQPPDRAVGTTQTTSASMIVVDRFSPDGDATTHTVSATPGLNSERAVAHSWAARPASCDLTARLLRGDAPLATAALTTESTATGPLILQLQAPPTTFNPGDLLTVEISAAADAGCEAQLAFDAPEALAVLDWPTFALTPDAGTAQDGGSTPDATPDGGSLSDGGAVTVGDLDSLALDVGCGCSGAPALLLPLVLLLPLFVGRARR